MTDRLSKTRLFSIADPSPGTDSPSLGTDTNWQQARGRNPELEVPHDSASVNLALGCIKQNAQPQQPIRDCHWTDPELLREEIDCLVIV